MIYSISRIREYVRTGLDKRLENSAAYSDSWVDYRIEEGMAIAEDIKPIFYAKEKYDLTNNITVDMLTEVEIIVQEEVHAIWAVECDLTKFTVEVTPNNHVIIRVIPNAGVITDYTVTVRYYFYPTMPFSNIEMTMEMWKLVKDGIAVACFSMLQDKESEQYHQAKAESYVIKSTLDIDKEMLAIDQNRLWRGSWA